MAGRNDYGWKTALNEKSVPEYLLRRLSPQIKQELPVLIIHQTDRPISISQIDSTSWIAIIHTAFLLIWGEQQPLA